MKIKKLILDFKAESKIPKRDKILILVFLFLSIAPVIFIPGWITLEGFIISLFLFAFIPDYLFNIINQNLFLSHYPYGLKSYTSLKRFSNFITIIIPRFITAQLWEYKKDIYD